MYFRSIVADCSSTDSVQSHQHASANIVYVFIASYSSIFRYSTVASPQSVLHPHSINICACHSDISVFSVYDRVAYPFCDPEYFTKFVTAPSAKDPMRQPRFAALRAASSSLCRDRFRFVFSIIDQLWLRNGILRSPATPGGVPYFEPALSTPLSFPSPHTHPRTSSVHSPRSTSPLLGISSLSSKRQCT